MIRTFSEQIDDNASVAEIKTTLSEARLIVFLGSAFHQQNLEVLKVEIDPNAKVLCTARGVSDGDLKVVKSEIASIFSTQEIMIDFAKLHCNEFFENYWRTLTS